jgi:hypothetical protein
MKEEYASIVELLLEIRLKCINHHDMAILYVKNVSRIDRNKD